MKLSPFKNGPTHFPLPWACGVARVVVVACGVARIVVVASGTARVVVVAVVSVVLVGDATGDDEHQVALPPAHCPQFVSDCEHQLLCGAAS